MSEFTWAEASLSKLWPLIQSILLFLAPWRSTFSLHIYPNESIFFRRGPNLLVLRLLFILVQVILNVVAKLCYFHLWWFLNIQRRYIIGLVACLWITRIDIDLLIEPLKLVIIWILLTSWRISISYWLQFSNISALQMI